MAKLKLSTGVIKATLDHSLDGVCIIQKTEGEEASGRIVYVNDAFCQLSQFSRSELIGKFPNSFTTEDIHFGLIDSEKSIVVEGNILSKSNGNASIQKPVLAKFSLFSHEGIEYNMGSFQDRTELVTAKAQTRNLKMQQAEWTGEMGVTAARFTALLQNVPDVVWECDKYLNLSFISDNSETILGYPPEDLLDTPLYNYMGDEFQNFFIDAFPEEEELTMLEKVEVTFLKANGSEITLEISANPVIGSDAQITGMIGTIRDITNIFQPDPSSQDLSEGLTIRINSDYQLIFASPDVLDFLPSAPSTQSPPPDFLEFLTDSSVAPLFSFAFDQGEDMPFPVEVRFVNASGNATTFSINFQYNAEEGCLEGELIPANTKEQLAVMSQKIEKQKESIENSISMDPEMEKTVISDSQGLTADILDLVKSLEVFGYPVEDEVFNIELFTKFIEDKNIHDYRQNIRLLGNKIHGLKGTSGFLIPASKKLCHHIEEITRPLAEHKLVFTSSLASMLKQFVFKVEEMLESYQKDSKSKFDIEDWLERIDHELEKGQSYIGDKTGDYLTLLVKHSTDSNESKKNKTDDFISVSQQGYETLSEQVKSLFYMASENLSDDSLIKAGSLYNEFLDTHQRIIKVPPNLSRYERLIPSWAKEYDKEAEFIFKDHKVRADLEFWIAMHEIYNHSLKNAVIHGLEPPEERESMGKNRIGKVIVEIQEDALHLYITIWDDGRGINIEKMSQKALENRVISQEQLQQMSKEDILNLVFVQGVSTAETLDDNAGRGVGMNAVQEAMRQFQGKCRISSEMGYGTSWNFSFPKSNVSLPCFIVTIGNFRIAIPENHVEAFYGYRQQHVRQINQKMVFRRTDEIIPLLNSQQFFDNEIRVSDDTIRRILIIQAGQEKMGIVINDIIHHATMPILPLPEEYRNVPIYLGATLFGSNSVLVLNANQMFSN